MNNLSEMSLDNRRILMEINDKLHEITISFNEMFQLDDTGMMIENEHIVLEHEPAVERLLKKMKELDKFHNELKKYSKKLTPGEFGES